MHKLHRRIRGCGVCELLRDYSAPPGNTLVLSHTPQIPLGLSITQPLPALHCRVVECHAYFPQFPCCSMALTVDLLVRAV